MIWSASSWLAACALAPAFTVTFTPLLPSFSLPVTFASSSNKLIRMRITCNASRTFTPHNASACRFAMSRLNS